MIQPAPEVLIGLLAALPNPASVPQGYFYFATDTVQLFLSAIDPVSQVRTWDPVVSGSTPLGIPLDQIAFGNATSGITSSPQFMYDPILDRMSLFDENGKIFLRVDGVSTSRRVFVFDENGFAVTAVSGRAAVRLVDVFDAAGNTISETDTKLANRTERWFFEDGTTQLAQFDAKLADINNAFQYAVPANPQFFVSSAGNDGPTHKGTVGDPLATLNEAYRRLRVSGWTGQPIVTVATALALGTNPLLEVPAPVGSANPILTQGVTTIQPLGTVAPTGGTAGTSIPPANATITSAAVTVANAYRGMFVRFTAGPLLGQRRVVVSNDGAGGFVLAGTLSAAPIAADTFVVEDLVSKLSYTGTLNLVAHTAAFFDLIQVVVDNAWYYEGFLLSTSCKFTASAAPSAGANFMTPLNSGMLWCGGNVTPPYQSPASVDRTAGCRFDGSANDTLCFFGSADGGGELFTSNSSFFHIDVGQNGGGGSLSVHTINTTFETCGLMSDLGTHSFSLRFSIFTGMRINPIFTPPTPLYFGNGVFAEIQFCNIAATAANNNCIEYLNARGIISNLAGANPAAGIVPLILKDGASVTLGNQPTITGTGGAGVNEVKVGGNANSTWALVFGGLTGNSTDVGAASSQLCHCGP